MSTLALDNMFDFSNDRDRAEVLVSVLEAPYQEAVVSDEVKVNIDQTIERYGVAKSLLELHVLSVGLCLGIEQNQTELSDDEDDLTSLIT